ncbi:MAG: hypothetical protein QUS35_12280 [bacterium]|nr:hypothetical protein [bacterium]
MARRREGVRGEGLGAWGRLIQPFNIRRIILLALLSYWTVRFFYFHMQADWKTFIPLIAIVLLYIFEIIDSITVSSRTTEVFKSFVFQTTVPVVALIVVCILTLAGSIDGPSVITLFGLSLAYTTYVVGKRIQGEDVQGDPKNH